MIYYDDLYAHVVERVRALTKKVDSGELLKHIRKEKQRRGKKDRLIAEREKINKRLAVLKRVIRRLYEDMGSELMPAEDYREMLAEYSKEQKTLHERLAVIEARLSETENDEQSVAKLKAVLDELLDEKELSGAMLSRLIERIEIGHTVKMGRCNQEEVTIYYRFIGAVEEN